MKNRICIEDITEIALYYARQAGIVMLSHETILKYNDIVEEELEEKQSKISVVHPINYAELIYYNGQDENENWYSILKPETNLEDYEYNRLVRMPYDLQEAVKRKRALEMLGLQLVERKIIKLEEPLKRERQIKRSY